ncbi:iron complex outermembrane recepter protein [Cyclobacterium xiamenense]|uniref:Iron complex outermembrane recepter protein n=1 Tax=Cyclobacterium xiamenense TaxID=1297121 RepID=A0A1H6U0V2_9BACT|nr:TonB-dependent receptor [Cyclobacterium xiamenense]SEI82030.1 iron complex outermembrane recepter protein [Cyclobacterium xiamenense]
MKTPTFCYLLLLFSGWASSLQAQEPDSLGMSLDQVVVTGTRAARAASQVSASISIIDRDQLDQSSHINVLPSIVPHVPGLLLNDRSTVGFGVGPGSGGNLSIRGISGTPNNRILVLIDGQPQFMGIFSHPIADAYHATDIERVEVIRGAASVLYGSNAMGGAINLITAKNNSPGWSGQAAATAGSFGTRTLSGKLSFQSGKWESVISLNHGATDGFRDDAPDGFSNTSVFYKLTHRLGDGLSLAGDVQLSDASYQHPGTVDAPLSDDQRDYRRGRVALGLTNEGDKASGAVLLYHNFGEHRFTTGFESVDFNQGLSLYQNLKLVPRQTLTLGVEHSRFGGEANNDRLPPPAAIGLDATHRVRQTEVYLQVQQAFWQKLHLNAGVREVYNSQFGNMTVPGFGLSFEVNPRSVLKASSSRAFRSPSVVDLFLFPPSNMELRPESLWNHELGFLRSFSGGKWDMELVLYYTKGDNLIQVDAEGGPPQNRNTGAFRNKGLESQVNFKPTGDLGFLFSYNFADVSENVLFAPRHYVKLQMNGQLGNFQLVPFVQQVFGLRNSLVSEAESETYSLLNLQVNYQITARLRAHVLGNNLLDSNYQLENGYPMPGINMAAGINYQFKPKNK